MQDCNGYAQLKRVQSSLSEFNFMSMMLKIVYSANRHRCKSFACQQKMTGQQILVPSMKSERIC